MANISFGTDFCIFITTGSTKKVIANSTSCKFDSEVELIDVSTKDDGKGKRVIPGRHSWSIDCDSLYSTDVLTSGFTYDTLVALHDSDTLLTVTFALVTNIGIGYPQTPSSTVKQYQGTAYIQSISTNAKNNDPASFTIKMVGVGRYLPI